MTNLLQVVYKLNQASTALKKAHWSTISSSLLIKKIELKEIKINAFIALIFQNSWKKKCLSVLHVYKE